MRTRLQEWRWRTWNRVRQVVRAKPIARPCCRKPENLGPREALGADLSFQRCQVCGSRHFEAIAHPGNLRVVGRR